MNLRIRLAGLLIVVLVLGGCDNWKCRITCTSGAALETVGFTFAELDGVTVNAYANDGTFTRLVSSQVITKKDSFDRLNWVSTHPTGSYDSSGDSFYCTPDPPLTALIFDQARYDVEVIVPSASRTYRFTNINFTGAESEQQKCGEKVLPQGCSRQLTSYTVNGIAIVVNSVSSLNAIVVEK